MERLDLGAQGVDRTVVQIDIAVQPLAQHTAGVIQAAGELRPGVQGIAQVGSPLVVGHLRPLDLIQHGRGLDAELLGALNAQDVGGGHAAEQQHGDDRADNPDHNGSSNTFTHGIDPPCLIL